MHSRCLQPAPGERRPVPGMGGLWSAPPRPAPRVTGIRVAPSAACPLSAPLDLQVTLSPAAAGVGAAAASAVWTLSLEVDVAHARAVHALRAARRPAPSGTVRLRADAAAFAEAEAAHAPDALANVAALHVRGVVAGADDLAASVVMQIWIGEDGVLMRRLYGCAPMADVGGDDGAEEEGKVTDEALQTAG